MGTLCLLPVRCWGYWEDRDNRVPWLAPQKTVRRRKWRTLVNICQGSTQCYCSAMAKSEGNISFRLIASSKQEAEPQSFNPSENCTKVTTPLSNLPCPKVLQKWELVECVPVPVRNQTRRVHSWTSEAEVWFELQHRKYETEGVAWGISLCI